jgi:hypothetical protein
MTAAAEITAAARAWLDGLDERQRQQAQFGLASSERFVWAYTPGPREGLALRDMRPDQRVAAEALVDAAMSARARGEIAAIIQLEPILGRIEQANGRGGWMRRDPELYWFAVFGEPGGAEPWAWRLEGHHVSIHIALAGDRVEGSTPSFLGSNPAVIPSGYHGAGARALTGEETLARELLVELAPEERRAAVIADRAPADILTGIDRVAELRSITGGVRYADLGDARRISLERLTRHYVDRLPPDVAEQAWDRITSVGLHDVRFAWAGGDQPGQGHYYSVRGPSFVIEYDNTQDGANHIHSVWRDLERDWGGDLLARHVAAAHS